MIDETIYARAAGKPWPRIQGFEWVKAIPCPLCGRVECPRKVIAQACHPGAGLVAFTLESGAVYLACAACGEPVVALALEEKPTRDPVPTLPPSGHGGGLN